MHSQLESVGAVICAAGADLAPADRKMYALRDVTGTVESIPLLASSIMSKKIAEGTGALVLDVKTGSGAFLRRPTTRGGWLRRWSHSAPPPGVRTTALLTDMSTPLGLTAGNAVEVAESLEVLAGAARPTSSNSPSHWRWGDAGRRRAARRRPRRPPGRRQGRWIPGGR